jgi:cysteine desulfurase/selenocysteine lyase
MINPTQVASGFDVHTIRRDFPALHQEVYGKPLAYFDNAATAQKPIQVIERIDAYYRKENSNVHRGVHYLSQWATEAYEQTRLKIKALINAEHAHEVIFTKGTTESINLVAHAFSRKYLKPGDEVLISGMEHHANIVPWQMACEESGAVLKVIPVTDSGELDMEAFSRLLSERTKILSIVHISNTLGTVNPVQEMIRQAHALGVPVLVDAAQTVPHMALDVQVWDCDFLVFSGHKMFGPTGTGILYGKEKWLNDMPPFMGGGSMIKKVTFEKTTYNELPHKFEPGTPHIAGGIGLGAAVDYIQSIGYEAIGAQESALLEYATKSLEQVPEIRIIGQAAHKAGVISFLIGDIHPYDAGTILDRMGVAIRTGHHCTQPLMDRFGIPGTMRASFAFYNTFEEIDRMMEGIQRVRQMFS